MLNVAFENPRKLKHRAENRRSNTVDYLVPDRISGMEELEELKRLCPSRKWNFVSLGEIDHSNGFG